VPYRKKRDLIILRWQAGEFSRISFIWFSGIRCGCKFRSMVGKEIVVLEGIRAALALRVPGV